MNRTSAETLIATNKTAIKSLILTEMSDVVDVSDFFKNGLHTMRMTPGDDPRVSIIDFVMAVTGQTNKHASNLIMRMYDEDGKSTNSMELGSGNSTFSACPSANSC